ncbi:glycoside hydrolase family 6 protein [Paractinoplanes hotanensis]|uniref:Glucanase n=1 Tax=Paractinoplanes hotanensis TaxID=2906497 RepID=A0ABT0XR80_9ACTN|nr:glycoside hydrolase family 6 protein [Actinoplanes hotanensis]MCM4076268.1 glycoside hydrolase family 6 protein [Actinoplanes hotanensis]
MAFLLSPGQRVVAAGLAAALAAGWPSRVGHETWSPPPPPTELYVERTGPAVEQLAAYEKAGRTTEAALIRKIADRPVATWFADSDTTRVGRVMVAARGFIPVVTLYYIPHRDCASHSAGGAATGAAYSAWIDAVAAALTGRRAIVILEPDAVAQSLQGCLTTAQRAERYRLLTRAIATLTANRALTVYLDGGNPAWITDTATMAGALRKAGVARARGFALNVANFETTAANIRYGARLSQRLGGARFVIDTSRNGNGPARKSSGDRHWCNPPGRALGNPPTLKTGRSLVDAYLWIKRPGESDGACGRGAPPAGRWWPAYALELASGA